MGRQQSSQSNRDDVRQDDQHGTNYSELNPEELLVAFVDHIWLTYQCALKILNEHKPGENRREAERILQSRTDDDWVYLYQLHQDRLPIEQLAKWKCELSDLNRELFLRLREKPVGFALLQLEEQNSSADFYHRQSKLVKLIIRRRDLKWDDNQTIIDVAIEKLLRIRKRLTQNLRISFPLNPPRFPKDLGLPTRYGYNFYRSMAKGLMKKYLPIYAAILRSIGQSQDGPRLY